MIAKHTPRVFALLVAAIVATAAPQALAFCSSCGVPAATYSAGYAAPVAYTAAYAPATYTTAYAPTYTTYSSGWYPGRFLGRVNRAIWGYPTTTYYAPAYTAAYAPTYTAAYAPSYSYGSYAPACSSCSTCSTCTASYAPACDLCSACSVSYAPACSTCSTCDACAASGTTCASCAAGTVSQSTYVEQVPSTSTATVPQSSSPATSTTESQPTLAPTENPPATRTYQESQKPAPADPVLQPEPQGDTTDDGTTNLQAPQLFDPNDRTAERHRAPVWTAVYHKTSGAEPSTQTVSWPQQAELDAAGWVSDSE